MSAKSHWGGIVLLRINRVSKVISPCSSVEAVTLLSDYGQVHAGLGFLAVALFGLGIGSNLLLELSSSL